jgi:hypothetical protein
MNKIKVVSVILFIFLISPIVISSELIMINGKEESESITIRVAQYPRYAGCDETLDLICNYAWQSNGTWYRFVCTELTYDELSGTGEHPLNIDNFALLYVGANFDACTKDGLNKKMSDNIKNFLIDGGGYIGVCAGTSFASQGYEKPVRSYQKHINKNCLKIADVYINQDLTGEVQYEFKNGVSNNISQGLLPLENRVVRNNSNPLFLDYNSSTINLSYGGGPGMYVANANDPNLGEVTPLLIINEELMKTKPIHWYRKALLGWVPLKKVKTDMLGQYGGIATTYGKGKIVIFTGHPEIRLVPNGTIKEFIGKTTGFGIPSLLRAVYSWIGTPLNISHNWWIHRRAAAWIAGVPAEDLPPCNELMAFIDKPQFRFGLHEFYFEGEGLIYGYGNQGYYNNSSSISKPSYELAKQIVDWAGMTVIAGNITAEGYAENSDIMEFYVDGVLQYTDTKQPFEWRINNGNFTGVHSLELRSYDEYGNYAFDHSDFFFMNI